MLISILPKLLLLTTALLIVSNPFQIPPKSPASTPSLQFSNYTGPDVTTQMSNYYLQAIYFAYTFFAEDISNNTLWIQNRLQEKYGYKFNVVILKETGIGGVVAYKWFYVEWLGVNKKQPNWVYAIYTSWNLAKNLVTTYVDHFGSGIGIDESKQKIIQNVIKNEQENTPESYVCDHNYISSMTYDMYIYDHQEWGIIVKPISSTRINARIYSVNSQYYSLKTDRCQYLIYVTE